MNKPDTEPTITISLSRAVPVEQYGGKAEVFVCLQGITAHTTPEEMDAMLAQGGVAYSKMVPFLKEKMKARLEEIVQERREGMSGK